MQEKLIYLKDRKNKEQMPTLLSFEMKSIVSDIYTHIFFLGEQNKKEHARLGIKLRYVRLASVNSCIYQT